MAINTEIQRIETAKINLKAAIEAKGVAVPNDKLISDYSDYVDAIPTSQQLADLIERGIVNIVIPNGTTTIGISAFSNCRQLVTVYMPATVTSIGESAFQNCSALENVVIPSSMTTIGLGAYRNCTSITNITVYATTPPSISSNTFYGCNNLAHIYVPAASVDIYKTANIWQDYSSIIEAIPTAE